MSNVSNYCIFIYDMKYDPNVVIYCRPMSVVMIIPVAHSVLLSGNFD